MIPVKTHVRYRGGIRTRRPAEKILAALISERFRGQERPVVIAVGGPGGTGKTAFSRRLAGQLGDSTVLHLDHYKTPRAERESRKLLGSHPAANRLRTIRAHVQNIRDGRPFDAPVYDDRTGRADGTVPFTPGRINILDGEISVYRQFRDLVDFAVFIDSDWKTQLNTRLFRDIGERGYSREKVIHVFLQSNLRDFIRYGAEAKKWADVHLYCNSDYNLRIESVSRDLYADFEDLLATDLAAVDISGLILPVLTPFNASGEIDQKYFIEHLEFLAKAGVGRVLVNGTTGEFFSLDSGERRLLLRLARTYFPGVILFQAGTESLIRTKAEIRWAEEDGADGVLVLPPYYFAGAPESGLVRYFEEAAACSSLPVILYNFPKHTGNPLTPGILNSVPHFGMKDSSARLDLIPHTPRYFVGGDTHILEACMRGAAGFVSARANVLPELFVAMEAAAGSGPDRAAAVQETINRVCRVIESGDSIPRLKALMNRIVPGYPCHLRPPLTACDDTEIRLDFPADDPVFAAFQSCGKGVLCQESDPN
ncbi:MAG TPA: hypothetical protein ENN17_11980 [bacterium]|nr:hypothetical protein [bacterium]